VQSSSCPGFGSEFLLHATAGCGRSCDWLIPSRSAGFFVYVYGFEFRGHLGVLFFGFSYSILDDHERIFLIPAQCCESFRVAVKPWCMLLGLLALWVVCWLYTSLHALQDHFASYIRSNIRPSGAFNDMMDPCYYLRCFLQGDSSGNHDRYI